MDRAQSASPQFDLTKRQTEVLDVIREHIEKHGAPPTRAEIAKKLGFKSVNAAEDHLKALARKGAIALFPGTSRGIQLVGSAASGLPVLCAELQTPSLLDQENIRHRVKVDSQFFSLPTDFLYCHEGSRLPSLGIETGDHLFIHQSTSPQSGQLVIVRLNHHLTVRRYTRTANGAELQSEDNQTAIRLSEHEPSPIAGIVVGMLRPMSI